AARHRYGHGARPGEDAGLAADRADARTRLRGRRRDPAQSGVGVDLSRAQRQPADEGDGHGRRDIPFARRSRRGDRAGHRFRHRPRMGILVPPCRPPGRRAGDQLVGWVEPRVARRYPSMGFAALNPSYEDRSFLMGRVVTFAQLTPQKSDGVGTAAITRDDVREMSASYVRVEPGKRWSDRVPDESDCYLFVVGGSGAITSDDARHAFFPDSFATIAEGRSFTVENNGAGALEMVRVFAPPNGGRGLPGFNEKM